MRSRLASWVRFVAEWLGRIAETIHPCQTSARRAPDGVLKYQAALLIDELETRSAAGTSGEYKRHAVYAQLIKVYPERRKRDLAMAIELAMQERP